MGSRGGQTNLIPHMYCKEVLLHLYYTECGCMEYGHKPTQLLTNPFRGASSSCLEESLHRVISPSSSSSKRCLIVLNTFSCHSLRPLFSFYTSIMDLLVAQYSRPAFQDEGYSSQEQQELSETAPPLSLRFAMPPVAKVNCRQL